MQHLLHRCGHVHHGSALFQEAGLRTESLLCVGVLCFSPVVPLEFLHPDYLLPQRVICFSSQCKPLALFVQTVQNLFLGGIGA